MKKKFEVFVLKVGKIIDLSPKVLDEMFEYYTKTSGASIISVIALFLLKKHIEVSDNDQIKVRKYSRKFLQRIGFLEEKTEFEF